MERTDTEIIGRILKGKKEDFETLVKKYQASIINYVYRMIGDYESAVDLSQEVFLKVYLSLDKYDKKFRFSTWLYKIASNLTIDHLRKRKLKTLSIDSGRRGENDLHSFEIPSRNPGPDSLYLTKDLRERIERSLRALPEEYREILTLRHINGLSYNEIAAITSLPPGTVKNRIFRARRKLKEIVYHGADLESEAPIERQREPASV